MDFQSLTFVGLMTLGIVNVVTFWKPDMDSKLKFALSIASAFALTFVPAELGNVILEKAKLALEVAFAVSGGYKIATRIGGK
jgi:hypothetical protein